MLQWYNNKMDTNTANIILHWIAHFWGQVNKARPRPKCSRPRPTRGGRGRSQNFGLEALTSLVAIVLCRNVSSLREREIRVCFNNNKTTLLGSCCCFQFCSTGSFSHVFRNYSKLGQVLQWSLTRSPGSGTAGVRFFTGQMSSMSPTQQCQSIGWITAFA